MLAGLFVGGMIPFIFSALCIQAVGRAAMDMVQEVRRQFREIPGIMEYKAKPEYEKCVAISTKASIREMMMPGAIALITPVIVGFTFGPEVLGGLLAGVTVSGVLMGIFQTNAGGAWDNAKKSFEKGVEINGEMFYKKSEPHKASVTGDTVGDPFKDTATRIPSRGRLIRFLRAVRGLARGNSRHEFKGAFECRETIDVELSERTGTRLTVTHVDRLEARSFGGWHGEEGDALFTADGIARLVRSDELGGERVLPDRDATLQQLALPWFERGPALARPSRVRRTHHVGSPSR